VYHQGVFENTRSFWFLGSDKANKNFYIIADSPTSKNKSLYKLELDEYGSIKSPKIIFENKDYDIFAVGWDDLDMTPGKVAFGINDSKAIHFKNSRVAKVTKKVSSLLKDKHLYYQSSGKNSTFLFLSERPDKVPTYYRYDERNNTLQKLLSYNEKLEKIAFHNTKVMKITSQSNKHDFYAFLTLPNNKKNFPIILLLEDNFLKRRQENTYNPTAQFLASQGFGVLRVIGRGSFGISNSLYFVGKRKVRSIVQKDINYVLNKVHEKGYGKKGNVCIWGQGHGAYVAVNSIATNQTNFACAAAMGGVYNIKKLFHKKNKLSSNPYWSSIFKDSDRNTDHFPVEKIKSISKPIFLIHGERDLRSNISQTSDLYQKLKAEKKNVMFKKMFNTGSDIVDEQDRKLLYLQLVKFFEKHLKK
jgi:dipeptidyl aminopeptidase/acylaminoacyl peptidase